MKKSLKGIVLASLISTQVLAAPISAFAVTAEPTETSEQVGPHTVEEAVGEVAASNTAEETSKESVIAEAPQSEELAETDVEEKTELPVSEEAPEAPITPTEETPVTSASEEKKQAAREKIASAQAVLDEGTYMAETTIPLRAAMAAATALLSEEGVTDAQLDAAIAEIETRVAGLVKAEVELSFARNLIMAIDEATQIINNTDDFKDVYTPASVAAKKANIQQAIDEGKIILAEVVDANGKIIPDLAVNNRQSIVTAADAIIAAIHDGNGLVHRGHLADILLEASRLEGAKVASDEDKADFEAALKQAAQAYDNALTDAEADAAVSALRTAMDNLRLVVVVSAVDEEGRLIMNQADTSLNGLYKTAWTVEPPVIDGYEYVSSNNEPLTVARTAGQSVSGTFGDGTNDLTFVYKSVDSGFELPYMPAPKAPADDTRGPGIIGVANNLGNNTQNTANKTYYSKNKLPKTGEQTNAMGSFGLIAVAASALAFFKKRKIKE
ncbi:hypothetical protein A5821_001919 [Enterococcus sp. 7F3_DIV0205]|uniref:Gram-positive cocci surface proteins LPxTG domain-containing protein n=1 Tax=Candidatus Enterococcus palustris TaxID=1834189 RepID=A0AAQ3W8P6_9ENTE|nr:MucBP domain-containing protein [Enterococcus sp. 7F3_DIV0205]OTN82355.1 hypothetical protein A5821_002266 [Enterococcus sp. 7F3_DIV0205]